MLDENQQVLIRNTYATIVQYADTAGQLFYERLFELEPSLRHMFHVQIDKQGHHFMLAVSAIVTSMAAPHLITPMLRQLGSRHKHYGVHLEHFAVMKTALLDCLRHLLGTDYTPHVEHAWSNLYDWLVQMAQEGLYAQTG